MASTLIIGIGTTGLNIIEEAQQWHYEFTGKNKPDGTVEYLFFETDINKKPKKTPTGESDITPVILSLTNHNNTIDKLKNESDVDNEWVPDVAELLFQGDGAGGMASYGRLSLWDSINFARASQAIRTAYQNIHGNANTEILIVGTLTGGTGSGLCVDMPYLVKEITKNDNVNAIFLLPDNSTMIINEDSEKLYTNTFCALSALDFYTNKNNNYNVRWSNNFGLVNSEGPPYKYIQYLSIDFNDATGSINFNEMLRVAGLNLLLNYIDSDIPNITYIKEYVKNKRVDGYQHHNTIGLKMIQYPKSELEELFSIKICDKILSNWIDSNSYYDNDEITRFSTIKDTIIKDIPKVCEKIIEDSFEIIDGITGPHGESIIKDIDTDIEIITKKNIDGLKPIQYLKKMFSGTVSNNYYSILSNNDYKIKDNLISEIISILQTKSDKYQNLYITKEYLSNISSSILKLVEWYENEYNIKQNNWEINLEKSISDFAVNINSFKIIKQEKQYYQYVFKELLKITKIYFLIPILKSISNSITGNKPVFTSKSIVLPTLDYIDHITKEVNSAINGTDSNYEKSFIGRKKSIEKKLDTDRISFYYVYTNGSVTEDLKAASNKYYSDKNNTITTQKIININTWNYWSNIVKSKKSFDLFSDFHNKTIKVIKQKKLFTDVDIIDIIKRMDNSSHYNSEIKSLFNGNLSDIREKLPPFVSLEKKHGFIPASNSLMYLFHDKNNNQNNSSVLPNCPVAPQQHAYANSPSLKNVLIFYQEYGYMGSLNNKSIFYNPILHNKIISKTKESIKKFDSEKKQELKTNHAPYLSLEYLKKLIKDN
jgi:hypothetical protein